MIRLSSCRKGYAADQDKAVPPSETLRRVRERLDLLPYSLMAETRRIDTGRLGIPVFISRCGSDAAALMPTRKQMGKGATPEQAEASAVMELMERFAFFSFWERQPGLVRATWDEAETLFAGKVMPLEEVTAACHDALSIKEARAVMNTRSWAFFPATDVRSGEVVHVPLDLFRLLNEFNGSSAGNTDVESIFQGACELVERHVCCLAAKNRRVVPTIDLGSCTDPVLTGLVDAFRRQGIHLLLKDFSLDLPVPSVAALAYDPASLGDTSEIVFTAGTAASPVKAAIRALTEVAQLGGDFCTASCYEPSGLPKYATLSETEWLRVGPLVPLHSLPDVEDEDILVELRRLVQGLASMETSPPQRGFRLYSVATTSPLTELPSHYSFVPGFRFRERAADSSLGLFAGRLLAEEEETECAHAGLDLLEKIYPNSHFIPFFRGLTALRDQNPALARSWFHKAAPLQPDEETRGLTAFYHGYAHSLEENWPGARPLLEQAVSLCPDQKEYRNLLGVCLFRLGSYAEAAKEFETIITRLDKGSAVDLQNLGLCRKFLGQTEDAAYWLRAALAADPSLEAAAVHLREIFGK